MHMNESKIIFIYIHMNNKRKKKFKAKIFDPFNPRYYYLMYPTCQIVSPNKNH